ncbi:MAG: LptF/LptG family permease, partial [Campylobacterales bacterium]|nr:LptF/LptG family permease [Campylobacterales bacterium]
FNTIFFPIFFVLYFIASIIFLIKISSLTAIIQMSFYDLFIIYLLIIPKLLFYILPICSFVSAVVSLTKLSNDNELIVLFSLGISPLFIKNLYLKIFLLISILLLFISIIINPLSEQKQKNYINLKKAEASLNIKSSQFGQKFGDWFVFVNSKDEMKFGDIVLFSKDEKEKSSLVISKNANVSNENGVLTLALENGKAFNIQHEKISQIDFEKMKIKDPMNLSNIKYEELLSYWFEGNSKRIKELSINILISIFPLISIYFVLSFGILNPRYQKNYSYLYLLLSVVIYYILAMLFSSKLFLISTLLLPTMWIFISYYSYKKLIKYRF